MGYILLQLFFSILITKGFSQAFNFYCSQDSKFINLLNMSPAQLDEKNECQILKNDDQKPLELLLSTSFNNTYKNAKLVYLGYDGQNFHQIFQKDNSFYLNTLNMDFQVFANKSVIANLNLKQSKSFQIKQCGKLIKEYLITTFSIIFCENENSYQIYELKEEELEFIISKNYEIIKQDNCRVFIAQNADLIIYFSLLDCQNWKIYMISSFNITLIYDSSFFNNNILRDFSLHHYISVAFDHQIFNLFPFQQEFEQIYENLDEKILQYKNIQGIDFIIIESLDNQNVTTYDNETYLIKRPQRSIEILYINQQVILNFGTHIESFQQQQQTYLLNVPQGQFIDSNLYYPYYIILSQNGLTLLKQNQPQLLLDCNKYEHLQELNLISLNDPKINTCVSGIVRKIEVNQQDILNFKNLSFQKTIIELDFEILFDQKFFLKNGIIPNFKIQENNFITCNQDQNLVQFDCFRSQISKSIWWILIELVNEQKIIYQMNAQSVDILDCFKKEISKIFVGEVIKSKNNYNFEKYLFFVYKQNSRILILDLQNQMKTFFLDFKNKVTNIIKMNQFQFIIILENCLSYLFQIDYLQFYTQYKIDPDGNCMFPKIIILNQNFIIKYPNIIEINKISFTVQIKIDEEEVVDLVNVNNNNIFLLLKENNKLKFSKYSLTQNLEILKLFDLPLFNFILYVPIKYEIRESILVVAARSKIDDTNVLLVYYLRSEIQNILLDIIKVDNFQFYLVSQFRLLISQNQQQFFYQLAKFSLNCSLTKLIDYEISYLLQVQSQSKINSNLTLNSTIQLLLTNNIARLQIKTQNFNETTLDHNIDPRNYVSGSLNNITSKDIDIIQPLIQFKPEIILQCDHFYNTVCFNRAGQYIILDIFSDQQEHIFVEGEIINIFKSNGHYFLNQNSQVTVFDQESNLIHNITKQYDCLNIFEIVLIDNLVIFQCQITIQVYLMTISNLQFIEEIRIYQCNSCKLIEVQNKLNTFIVYNEELLFNNQDFWIINLQEKSSTMNLQSVNLDITTQNQKQDPKQKNIIYFKYINNSYYELKYLLKYKALQMAQIYICQIDQNFQQILKLENLGIVRLNIGSSKFKKLFFLSNNDLIECLEVINSQISFSLYNISEIHKFKLVDRIFNIQLKAKIDDQSIQIYNESHFIYSQSNNQYEVCQINAYQLNITNATNQQITINFQNEVSNVSIYLMAQKQIDNYQTSFTIEIIWILGLIFLFIILFLLCLRIRSKFKKQTIAISEIEL